MPYLPDPTARGHTDAAPSARAPHFDALATHHAEAAAGLWPVPR